MPDPGEVSPQMVGIFDTNDNFALAMAVNELDRAGIIYDVLSIPNLSLNDGPVNPKWRIPPQRIMVSVEDQAEATALIEPLKYPLDEGENEDLEKQK